MRFRRAVGLAAFTTVVLHLAGYTGLYSGFDLTAIGRDILRRPYITIGMAAFAIEIDPTQEAHVATTSFGLGQNVASIGQRFVAFDQTCSACRPIC